MKKLKKNKGILFWITGLSGSGKTTIAKKIKPEIAKFYGPTILISGDNLRTIFNLKKYSKNARYKNALMFSNLCKFITNQKINVIFAVVGLFDKLHQQNRTNIQNYVEIYVRSGCIGNYPSRPIFCLGIGMFTKRRFIITRTYYPICFWIIINSKFYPSIII